MMTRKKPIHTTLESLTFEIIERRRTELGLNKGQYIDLAVMQESMYSKSLGHIPATARNYINTMAERMGISGGEVIGILVNTQKDKDAGFSEKIMKEVVDNVLAQYYKREIEYEGD